MAAKSFVALFSGRGTPRICRPAPLVVGRHVSPRTAPVSAARNVLPPPPGAGCGWEAFAQQRAAARFGGLPACADASHNLANPVHLDVGDGDRSFAIWTRGQPQLGEIVGHYLLFPHVGLAIELVDGVAVSWDGR
eukprot:7378695-Prymnesium_polylepis.1